MAKPDVFALKNSSLNAFLFADIGTELSGSQLTILSALARLGKDPWAEAARWAQAPKRDAVEALTASIIDMPLSAPSIDDARATASRLVLLLPKQPRDSVGNATSQTAKSGLPRWAWLILFYPWVLWALDAGLCPSPQPHPTVPAPPSEQFH